VSFIFADLIILPILDIYRKYYSWKVMGYILLTFYITMALAGYVVEFLFQSLGIIPQNRSLVVITEGVQWNYTTILNILFLLLAAVLIVRFLRTGGQSMLKMMNMSEQQMSSMESKESHHDRSQLRH
ncbi:MAG TPA: permease, partial [Ktedonobacteraceae bacterium]|nr:permease [Ktedonobacteraceae bacterium]